MPVIQRPKEQQKNKFPERNSQLQFPQSLLVLCAFLLFFFMFFFVVVPEPGTYYSPDLPITVSKPPEVGIPPLQTTYFWMKSIGCGSPGTYEYSYMRICTSFFIFLFCSWIFGVIGIVGHLSMRTVSTQTHKTIVQQGQGKENCTLRLLSCLPYTNMSYEQKFF